MTILTASTASELKAAFEQAASRYKELENMIHDRDVTQEFTIRTSGEAATIMTQIKEAISTHGVTGTGGAVVGGGGSFAMATIATAPFLGPFSLFVGLGAAILGSTGAATVSNAFNFGELENKYGADLINNVRLYHSDTTRQGDVYRITRKFGPYRDYGGGNGHG